MEEEVHFVTLSQKNFANSLAKIEMKKVGKTVEFLQNIPCFKSQTRKAITKYMHNLKPLKFVRGQTVYTEGLPASAIYIVVKGEFELAKKLPRVDRPFDGANLSTLGGGGGAGNGSSVHT